MPGATGVLLMTFGSATTAAGVRDYMESVRGGRPGSDAVVQEFERRYTLVGASPLVDITVAQAAALQRLLDAEHGRGAFRVEAGMLHSAPRIADAITALRSDGAERIIAVVLAPQYSPLILGGYERAVAAARSQDAALDIAIAGAWHTLPGWIDSLAERLDEQLAALPDDERESIPIIFTAHSVPRPVVDRDPAYIDQLRDTAAAVAARAALPDSRWQFAYQSAGHTPEEWLKPDVRDLLPSLHDAGHESLLVVPVQFVADHLEVLYDIDIAASQEAAALRMVLRRIAMPNVSPTFIRALAEVVERELSVAASR